MRDPVLTRSTSGQVLGLLKLMRPKQWIKNAFVLAPLVFTSEFMRAESVQRALMAVFLFCIASSATYVVNDMQDVERDRLHPTKSRTRPLAAGIVSMRAAAAVLALLYGVLIWGWFAMAPTMLVITGYLVLNLAYTFALKHEPVVDIFTIAIGFVLRVYAGATALSVPLSAWMFVTTLCLALYLASVKRRQELSHNGDDGRKVLKKYSVGLIDRYAEMSATGALFFYSMFVMSSRPEMVMTVPLVLFGLFRYWYVVEQLDGGESPTDVLFADWQLVVTVLAWVAVSAWALWPGG
ncbi:MULTISPECIES: decaprenyl-phosphate phosphoribosyltransferase [unclassified Massilia]|uniref:decaprenyl-phosphate phosphoribosyltransferase n=1 Tax=unclassified Massilia TaxID=2609279 RepID=UPI00177E5C79|nr:MULTISPECIES: decaprenyl-phosphate phosphoribosyltransferase [unclassified Massilia]MBD8529901.1 decaprenyl-phosphate phosphoribosyltransferase [Massilia sp. CFBP 13647]MBD8672087.1 decaprenyl-phosphate phosphoribosyltransferase [Massilia sp. CFBP 13721]